MPELYTRLSFNNWQKIHDRTLSRMSPGVYMPVLAKHPNKVSHRAESNRCSSTGIPDSSPIRKCSRSQSGRSGISLVVVTVSATEIVDHRVQTAAQECRSAGFRLRAST